VNIKDLFGKDSFNKKKFVEFFEKKGFYIVLVLCIVIVGATAVFVTTRNISSSKINGEDKVVSNTKDAKTTVDVSSKAVAQSSIDSTKKETVSTAVTNETKDTQANITTKDASKSTSVAQVVTGTQTAKTSTTQSATKAAPANPGFASPVFGQVTYEYSKDKLSYSKTLDQWMTHDGLDISSERGSQVKAVADGVVSDIKNDPRLGVVVVIDHQNGYKTMYGNLAADDMVTVNLKVKQGEVIGSIGNTALYEIAEAPHLHFEVMKNSVSVDPKSFLPKN